MEAGLPFGSAPGTQRQLVTAFQMMSAILPSSSCPITWKEVGVPSVGCASLSAGLGGGWDTEVL